MKATILGVGTELTSGQILNRNAPWISRKLYQLGIETVAQLVVPDDRTLITESLQFLAPTSQLLFVTGGLGPTSDDFTRELISQWSGRALRFNEASWEHLRAQLARRGLEAGDIHRQECYFPEGAEIFQNRAGTANAFMVSHRQQKGELRAFILPGPPMEIEALWQDFIHDQVKSFCHGIDPLRTWSWDCMGLAEAELANIVEPALSGCPLEKAYRVHLPYVEFKLTYRESQKPAVDVWQESVSKVLAPWTITRDGQDVAKQLAMNLHGRPGKVWICDELTGSHLLQRLLPEFKILLAEQRFQFSPSDPSSLTFSDPKSSGLHLQKTADSLTAKISVYLEGRKIESKAQAPERFRSWPERQSQYFAELAILQWLKTLAV